MSSRPKGVPPEALAMGPWFDVPGVAGALTASEQKVAEVHRAQVQAQSESDRWASDWNFACAEYLRIAGSARSQNWPMPAKPVPAEPQMLLRLVDDQAAGLVWAWKEALPLPTCPDLPPLPKPSPVNSVAIGAHLFGDYWQALPADTMPKDAMVIGTSTDGVSGKWLRLTALGMGGMGWYQKAGA